MGNLALKWPGSTSKPAAILGRPALGHGLACGGNGLPRPLGKPALQPLPKLRRLLATVATGMYNRPVRNRTASEKLAQGQRASAAVGAANRARPGSADSWISFFSLCGVLHFGSSFTSDGTDGTDVLYVRS